MFSIFLERKIAYFNDVIFPKSIYRFSAFYETCQADTKIHWKEQKL